VIIEHVLLDVTAEPLYTSENRLKIGALQGVGQHPSYFHVEGDVPDNHFRTNR